MEKSVQKSINIIELNEFSVELVKQTLKEHDLPHLKKVFLEFKQSSYKTNDRYNTGYLEPWVQWVSIHTGVPSKTHQIKHLGDVPDCQHKPFWQQLSELGVSTGVWGVMNGARGESPLNHFFFPDPWTFTEKAYPDSLNRLLDLPQYVAKNYQNLSRWALFTKGMKMIHGLMRSGCFMSLVKELFYLKRLLKTYGKHHFVYIAWFDYVVTLLFCQLKKSKPNVSILFLNSLAHIQHHYWTQGEKGVTPEILFGLKNADRILGLLLKTFPDDMMIVHNALSQMNTNHEKPWVLYRQKDPLTCLKALGLNPLRVEQHMTHDGHAFFATSEERDAAFTLLKSIRIEQVPLFLVEKNAHDETKLFYQLKFTDKVEPDVTFQINDKEIPFFSLFDEIVTRTGRHIPLGTVFSNDIHFPNHIFNHEFNQYIYNYYFPEQFKLKSEYLEDEVDACVL